MQPVSLSHLLSRSQALPLPRRIAAAAGCAPSLRVSGKSDRRWDNQPESSVKAKAAIPRIDAKPISLIAIGTRLPGARRNQLRLLGSEAGSCAA